MSIVMDEKKNESLLAAQEEAERELVGFSDAWNKKYAAISKSCNEH